MPDLLRIVSYNVRYFGHALRGLASTRTSKQGIALRLSELAPLADIICLQEVETVSLRSKVALKNSQAKQTQLEDFMEEFAAVFKAKNKLFPYEAFYFRAHTYQFGNTPLYTTGLAILVNLDRLVVEGHNVDSPHHITHHHVERWKDRKQSRICAHMRVATKDNRPLHIFNTHLSLPTPWAKGFWSQKEKMGFGSNQVKEAHTLSKFVQTHAKDEAFVVCGDFNSAPGSDVFKYLTVDAGLTCAQAELKQIDPTSIRGFPTAGFLRLRMHLDHLFSGGPLQWVDCEDTHPFDHPKNKFNGLSDHTPLIGRFKVKGTREKKP